MGAVEASKMINVVMVGLLILQITAGEWGKVANSNFK